MKFQPVRPSRKQIDTNFSCKALSFQLISIVSLLNLRSCDSNILKVNISDGNEREARNRESNDRTICLNCCTICGVFEFSNLTTARFSLASQRFNGFLFRDQQLDTELVKEFISESTSASTLLLVQKKIFFTANAVIKAMDSKGILNTLKKVLRQPWNALMLQVSLSLCDK